MSVFKLAGLKKLLREIAKTDSKEALSEKENILIVSVLTPMLLSGAVIATVLGIVWQKAFWDVILIAGSLLASGMGLIVIDQINIKANYKKHLISWCLIYASVINYMVFYENLGSLYWILIIILLVPFTLSTTKIMFYYNLALLFVLILVSHFNAREIQVTPDVTYFVTLGIIMFFVIAILIVINRIYDFVIQYKISQNTELKFMNQELIANEEELQHQYSKLHAYNLEISKNQRTLNFLAYKDALTGLPNRKMILEQLDERIDVSKQSGERFAIAFIDLDNFKKINDSLGHSFGDMILEALGRRLSQVVHQDDLVGRLGGDEFALLVRRSISEESMMLYFQKIMMHIKESLKIENQAFKLSASMGVAVWPVDGETTGELLRAADTAMYKVKGARKNDIQFFRSYMKHEILERIEMEMALSEALEKEELFIEYQPLIESKSHKIVGFEALLRWVSGKYGLVRPNQFIPLAEEIGLIYQIGIWTLEEVCMSIKALEKEKGERFQFSVNISPIQLLDSRLILDINEILFKTDIDPSYLILEITETIFIKDVEKTIEMITKLKALGVKIALDDFGTGFSSLNYLFEIPIDILKIDKSFTRKLLTEDDKKAIIKSIIAMAHDLHMEVIAEGVEKEVQVTYLENNNCDILQGYYFSRPVSRNMINHLKIDY